MKLPKQWRHWCRKNRLHTMGNDKNARREFEWFYLVGRGHVWRLNMHDMLQRGDTYEKFDRWARCSPIYEEPMPKTEAEFTAFVKRALEAVHQNDPTSPVPDGR